ncbi:MAG: hypothetical protein ACRYFB_15715 [Janthinobacterium lividum]
MENEILIQLSKQVADRNIESTLDDLRKLRSCFADIISLLDKEQIQFPQIWYEYYEAMAIKFRLNINSIIELYEIENNLPKHIIYHDLSSIYLLNRSLLETYLTFFYSYILPQSNEDKLMNYYIFKISGLVNRQNYSISGFEKINLEFLKRREDEKFDIEYYQIELQKLQSFIVLDLKEKEKNNLLKGKFAKRFGFIELIKMSKLKDILFIDMWKLYSNYAHCELLALVQINSYGDNPEQIYNALYGTLTNTLIVVSIMITDFIKVYKGTVVENLEIPKLDEALLNIIEFWHLHGTEL